MSDKPTYDELLDGLGKVQLPSGRGKDAIWEQIDSQIIEKKETKERKLNPTFYWVAASLTAVLALVYILYPVDSIQFIETSSAEFKTVDLPDGSVVRLNAGSSIEYSTVSAREIKLKGEAFFEVEKGETFAVITDNGTITVLGTSFNITSRKGDLEVTCKTGKVRVDVPRFDFSEAISPGEMVRMANDTIKKSLRKVQLIGTWQKGEFYFDNQNLKSVLEEMSRQFSVSIDVKAENKKFSGYFKNDNLESALESVCLPLGLTFKQNPNGSITVQ